MKELKVLDNIQNLSIPQSFNFHNYFSSPLAFGAITSVDPGSAVSATLVALVASLIVLTLSHTASNCDDHPDHGGRGGQCFGGDTYLQLVDGGLVTFRELSEMQGEGENLPAIASFDEESHRVVFQTPTQIIEHPKANVKMMGVSPEGAPLGHPLDVTPNHRLLIERNEEITWVPAGELNAADQLLNPYGEPFHFEIGNNMVEGAIETYDLTFSSQKTGMYPTYLVSPDGVHWIIAHNKV